MSCSRISECGALMAVAAMLGPFCPTTAAQDGFSVADPQYAAAVRLQRLESYDLAAGAWRGFLRDFPKDARAGKATHYLGVCLYQEDDPAGALAQFETVVRNYADLEMLETTYLYLGVTQFTLAQKGQSTTYEAALATFNRLVAKFPQGKFLAEALYYQGECTYLQGDKQEALAYYLKLIDNYPKHRLLPDALYALGVAQEELAQWDAAGKTYDTFLEKFPEHAQATEVDMRRGETLFLTGKYPEAASRFAQAAAAAGFALADHATFRQAESLARMRHYAQAAELYASLAVKFPQSKHLAQATLAGGKCYFLEGDYAKSQSLLDQAYRSGGESAVEAAHWVAQCLLKQDKPTEALAVVEQVLPKASGNPLLAQLLMDQADAVYEIPQRRDQATKLYETIASQYAGHPVAPQARYMAAFSALEEGDYQRALDQATLFLRAFPEDELAPDVRHIAAESNVQLGELAKAEQLYRQLLADYSDRAEVNLWRLRWALVLQLQKRHEEVVAALEPLVPTTRDPQLAAEVEFLLGGSQLELGRHQSAIEHLQKSLTAAPTWRRAAETRLTLAHAHRQLRDLAKARENVNRVIRDFPESPSLDRAYYRLGEYCTLENDYDAAAKAYRKVIDSWPESPLLPHALHELGCAELHRQNPADAETALTTLLDKFPEHPLAARARYARGMARQQLEKFDSAEQDLLAVLESQPSSPQRSDALYVLGLCQLGREQPAEAAATFSKLLENDSGYAGADNVHYQLAWALMLSGKKDESNEAFAALAENFPKSPLAPEAHHHVGERHYENKDYGRSAVAYYAAMSSAGVSPLGEKATHKLAWSYYHQGKFVDAQKTFHYQLATYADGSLAPDARFMRAECFFRQDQFEEALEAYQRVSGTSSPDFQTLALLHAGQAAAQLGQWEEADQWLLKCVQQAADSPYLPEALYERGWARQNLGEQEEALSLYQQVIAKTDAEVAARAQFMIGEIQFHLKQHEEAVKSYFKVVYGYGYPKWQANAAYEAARCFEVLEKTSQAVKMYRELIKTFPESDKVSVAQARVLQLEQ